jgi:exodeoxyribonuclease VII large subunit
VSNLRVPASGHSYFTLKDENAEVSAVLFRQQSIRMKDRLEEGKAVVARGKVSLYEARGTYQVIVRSFELEGKGDLREQFEKLVKKLRGEGLFDETHKKPLPFLPRVIGVITSRTGAAVKDITNMIWTRFPGAHVVLGPVAVQGDEAAGQISAMIDLFNAWGGADVLIVGRGGGSLEDLWAFNEEEVARAIFRSDIPVISAVGHEIDVTIADMVADVRALTPTKAGEMAVPDVTQENQRLDTLLERLQLGVANFLKDRRAELDYFRSHRIFTVPEESLRMKKREAADLIRRMHTAMRSSLELRREQVRSATEVLETLNPLAVLKRGFSYTEDMKGQRVTSAAKLKKGARVKTRLHKGHIVAQVVDKRSK